MLNPINKRKSKFNLSLVYNLKRRLTRVILIRGLNSLCNLNNFKSLITLIIIESFKLD